MIVVLTEIFNMIRRPGELPTPWNESRIIALPKKGNLMLSQNYRTINLISHSSRVMLKVIFNRLKKGIVFLLFNIYFLLVVLFFSQYVCFYLELRLNF